MFHRPESWTEHAACIGLTSPDRDPWAPGDWLTPEQTGAEYYVARSICAGCPVRMECVTDELAILDTHEPAAMRGGLTPDELLDLGHQLGITQPATRSKHGTRSRYVGGCRCDRCRNAHRIYEHERRLWAKTTRRTVTAHDVQAWLARPLGRGRHRAEPGQLLLFTDGLPKRYIAASTSEAS